jgi:hypothetical protein
MLHVAAISEIKNCHTLRTLSLSCAAEVRGLNVAYIIMYLPPPRFFLELFVFGAQTTERWM